MIRQMRMYCSLSVKLQTVEMLHVDAFCLLLFMFVCGQQKNKKIKMNIPNWSSMADDAIMYTGRCRSSRSLFYIYGST